MSSMWVSRTRTRSLRPGSRGQRLAQIKAQQIGVARQVPAAGAIANFGPDAGAGTARSRPSEPSKSPRRWGSPVPRAGRCRTPVSPCKSSRVAGAGLGSRPWRPGDHPPAHGQGAAKDPGDAQVLHAVGHPHHVQDGIQRPPVRGSAPLPGAGRESGPPPPPAAGTCAGCGS